MDHVHNRGASAAMPCPLLFPFEVSDEAFDEYFVRVGYREIPDTVVMERLLGAARKRLQVLRDLPCASRWIGTELTLQGRCLYALLELFEPTANDVRMCFTECEDFLDLPLPTRTRLLTLADALVLDSTRPAGQLGWPNY